MNPRSPGTVLREIHQKLGRGDGFAAFVEAAQLFEEELRHVVETGWNDLSMAQQDELLRKAPTELRNSQTTRWTLGQASRLLFSNITTLRGAATVHAPGVQHLDKQLIHWMADLRNAVVHGRKKVEVEEAAMFVDLVTHVLRVFGRVVPRGYTLPTLADVTPLLVEKIRGMNSSRGPSCLDVLGLTLDRAWSPLYTTFRAESARWDSQQPVALTLLLLDPTWDRLSTIDPSWPDRSARSLSTLQADAPDLVRYVPGLSVTVRVYRSWPAIHGFRIGDLTIASVLSARTSVGTFASTAPYAVTHADSPNSVEYLFHERFDERWHEAWANSQEVFTVGG